MMQLTDVQAALDTQRNTLATLPAIKYDGTAPIAPAPSVAYMETDFVPLTAKAITVAQNPEMERTGAYVNRLYSASGQGATLDDLADDVLALFPAHAAFTSNGVTVRIRGDIAPTRGLVNATTAGRSVVTITAYWQTRTAD